MIKNWFKNIPRKKRMRREARINSASGWSYSVEKDKTYSGRNVIRKYAGYYGVDLVCAIKELRRLGISIDSEYEKQVKASIEDRLGKKLKKKMQQKLTESGYGEWWDDEFAYIVGFTSGGVPFGIRHEEIKEDSELQKKFNKGI